MKDLSKDTWSGKRVEEWFELALARMWPRLVAWYSWFDRTQAGAAPGTYRYKEPSGISSFKAFVIFQSAFIFVKSMGIFHSTS